MSEKQPEDSQELFQGLSVLYTASEPLVDGTDAVVDALMDMVEAQLEESDIQVELTATIIRKSWTS